MTGQQTIDGVFFFDPEDRIYRDHFPGNPVVPGSVITGSFIQAAGEHTGKSALPVVQNFRFRRFVAPGKYEFCIDTSTRTFKCRLFGGEKEILVTGELYYEN
jgi:3-hydroxyacyl-[acyl-carrier-protein] dehydratase